MSSATRTDILARFRNIVVGEGRGEQEFAIWASQTDDPRLREALEMVRVRRRPEDRVELAVGVAARQEPRDPVV